ncbi:TonB-linked outer membrane protein, SusC/RagA family [Catalinimonas alkaloidigena]|uniref:TonB-linked outer membrane protein, SusC/RagA family n=1 Tax=Catalinimonas alkaloidigena TaxID=1075417 RepID=A0A1G9TM47_9BACT|nr:SusC/RagA family TonB-linked outer membrane protein [Catalinimonas alkaloidigena]SDM48836.1 TonB-linked outer membrane protein, SusC/RagA family [Catalinimonas alkaloidigena]
MTNLYRTYPRGWVWGIVLCLCGGPPVSAQHLATLTTPPTTLSQVQQISLENALRSLEKRYQISIVYETELVKDHLVKVEQGVQTYLSAEEDLQQLLRALPLQFKKVKPNVYLLLTKPNTSGNSGLLAPHPPGFVTPDQTRVAAAQPRLHTRLSTRAAVDVSGHVADEAGEGIPGVNVLEKGTQNGTITDVDGRFSLTIQAGAVLVFSAVGYETQEVTVANQSTLDVTLKDNVQALSEVVVVGYGTQKKESLTAAVAQITNEEIQTTTHNSLAQKLQGKVAGLQIRQNSGQPGDFNNSINIRGFGEPIYVIDGIRREGGGEFQRINPEDIESISILKDASAAIYGLGAANGVILVTTKKGKTEKPSFNYSTVYGAVTPTDMPEMASAAQYVQMYNDAQIFKVGGQPYYTQEELQNYINRAPGYEGTDWYGLTMKRYATQMQHNLSASGGNERTNYFVSFGHVREGGLLKSEDMGYKRYNLRANLTTQLTNHLEAQLLLAGRYDEKWEPGENFFNIFKGTRTTLPTEAAYANNNPLYPTTVLSTQNPVALAERDRTGFNENTTRNFQSSFALTYAVPFLPGLSLKGVAAYDANNYQSKGLHKPYNLYLYDATEDAYDLVPQRVGTGNLSNYNSNNNQLTLQGYVTYERQFRQAHHVNAVVVVEQQQWNDRWSNLTRYYSGFYTKDQIRFADRQRMENDGLENQTASLSYIGRLNYDFKGKYLAEFAFRHMGTYAYAPSNRWGFFPVATAGWRMSEENFMQNLPLISNLKLRGSFGLVGQPWGAPYQYIPGFVIGSGGSYEFEEGALTTGVSAPLIVNEKLSWVTARQTDIGIDLGLWQNKLTLEADAYQRVLQGIPAGRDVSLPNTFGSTLPEENLNSNQTQGFEFTLSHRNAVRGFVYNISGNFNFARTRNLHVERGAFTNSWDRYRNGAENRWNDLAWGYTYLGQFQSEEELLYAPMQNGDQGNIRRELPGDFRYLDLNNDGVIDGQDEAPIFYDRTPKMHYGLNLNASWKGLDLNILFQGAAKYTLRFTEVYAEMFAFRGNTPAYFFDRWRKADPYNPDSEWIAGTWPASRTVESVGRMYAESSVWRRDATYVRLKSVELGYTLPFPFLKKLGIQTLRVYASGFNLYTFADPFVKPFDPEKLEGLGDPNAPGFNSAGFTYPVTKTYNFGVNVSF